jgi:hypothetical protein
MQSCGHEDTHRARELDEVLQHKLEVILVSGPAGVEIGQPGIEIGEPQSTQPTS